MNELIRSTGLRPEGLPLTTRAAEGLERRRWTVAEIEAMTRAGVIDEDERFELIGGEPVPMSAKGLQHETLKNALSYHFVRNLSEEFRFAVETTFRMSPDTFVEPDFVFYRTADGLAGLNPATALLAVEVADSSLRWDLGRKALIYAGFGIPELWVIDVIKRTLHVQTGPTADGYIALSHYGETDAVSSRIPGLSVTLEAPRRRLKAERISISEFPISPF